MLKLSLLIAARDVALLEVSLVSVLQSRPADCEIVVVHDDAYNDPYRLAGEVRFVAAARNSDEIERLNVGVRACRAPVVHVLSCGAEVHEGWTDPVLRHFSDTRVAAVAPLLLSADGNQIESAGIEYRRSGVRVARHNRRPLHAIDDEPTSILGPAMSAAFYRASALERLHGPFNRSVGSRWADVDIALRLARAGYCAIVEPGSRVFAAPRNEQVSPLADAWLAERMFWQHARQLGWVRSTVSHLGVVFAEAAVSVIRPLLAGRVIGRLSGCLEHAMFGGRANDDADREPVSISVPAGLKLRDSQAEIALAGHGGGRRNDASKAA